MKGGGLEKNIETTICLWVLGCDVSWRSLCLLFRDGIRPTGEALSASGHSTAL